MQAGITRRGGERVECPALEQVPCRCGAFEKGSAAREKGNELI